MTKLSKRAVRGAVLLEHYCSHHSVTSNDILHPSGSSFLCIVCIIRQYLSSSTIRSRERACPSRSQGDEAPYAVAKNIMTKYHSSATISLKREFTKEDKLIPVITITVYLGTKEWDGPRKLSDMFGDVDEELLPFIPDYRINLLAPRKITDFTGFRTSIRQLFEVLQNAYDKEKMQEVLQNDEKFSKVDRETVEAINLFAGTDIDIDEKEEVIDMCKAWEEQKNEGRELGERQKIISLVVKKLQKDKSVAEIADDLEEKEEVIASIYEAALSMKPDYDVEKIYELLEKNKKLA